MFKKKSVSQKVFLCHSSQDKELVQKIATILHNVGISVWYDDWEIGWGDSIVEKINSGIESSSHLIVFLSSASISSNWVQRELSSALMQQLSRKDIKILPIKLEECPVPVLFKELKWISLSKPESYSSGLKIMFRSLLPEDEAENAIARLNEFLFELFSEGASYVQEKRTFLSCPNCEGRAVRIYSEKRDAPSGFEYDKGIQCEQCGMLFRGCKAEICPNCKSPMLWSSQGSSEGAYGKYGDDYAWECPKCRQQKW